MLYAILKTDYMKIPIYGHCNALQNRCNFDFITNITKDNIVNYEPASISKTFVMFTYAMTR